jgi:ATP-dependent Clp protease ATP-binding subunit ClpA
MMARPYTDRAKAALTLAEITARAHGDDRPAGVHLLLGLLGTENSLAISVLTELGVDVASLRRAARSIALSSSRKTNVLEDTTIAVLLNEAELAADTLEHYQIGTEHLLLGLFSPQAKLEQLLADSGIDIATTRAQVVDILSRHTPPSRRTLDTPDESSERGQRLIQAGEELDRTRAAKQRATENGDTDEAGRLRDIEKTILYRIVSLRTPDS